MKAGSFMPRLWNPARPGALEQAESLRGSCLEMTVVEWARMQWPAYMSIAEAQVVRERAPRGRRRR